ncbi:hypothetical protein Mal15_21630 [Stieleria maiorica]|uniref:Uncharacterized protein n=1 Tax=Stieleria maiorica TaxID=2795974 RepID=A0A5B9MCZ7_9BACT|nr:hypothetical protein Mal15_21630 [Stieleria maiorica]
MDMMNAMVLPGIVSLDDCRTPLEFTSLPIPDPGPESRHKSRSVQESKPTRSDRPTGRWWNSSTGTSEAQR